MIVICSKCPELRWIADEVFTDMRRWLEVHTCNRVVSFRGAEGSMRGPLFCGGVLAEAPGDPDALEAARKLGGLQAVAQMLGRSWP